MRAVDPAGWRAAVQAALDEGFTFMDWLGAVDEIGRAGGLRVVLVLRNLDSAAVSALSVEVSREAPDLDSLRDLLAGASWHEREVAELFGVRFRGGDPRRLLLDHDFDGTPLRKDEVLAARTGTPWPGGKEPGEGAGSPGRRRMVPPGLPDPQVWGDRPADSPDPDPTEVAESTAGGRVRRRGR